MSYDDYIPKLQDLTTRVNQIHKQPVLQKVSNQVSILPIETSDPIVHINKYSSLEKYAKYTYILIPIVGIAFYLLKPKFILEKPTNPKDKQRNVSISKLIFTLLIISGLVYGLNFALTKFVFT